MANRDIRKDDKKKKKGGDAKPTVVASVHSVVAQPEVVKKPRKEKPAAE